MARRAIAGARELSTWPGLLSTTLSESVKPGASVFTQIPNSPTARESERVNATIEPFEVTQCGSVIFIVSVCICLLWHVLHTHINLLIFLGDRLRNEGWFDDATRKTILDLMARGAAGGLFLTTDDCQASYEELKSRGVEFSEEPEQRPYGIDAGFHDASGNAFRLVQLPA